MILITQSRLCQTDIGAVFTVMATVWRSRILKAADPLQISFNRATQLQFQLERQARLEASLLIAPRFTEAQFHCSYIYPSSGILKCCRSTRRFHSSTMVAQHPPPRRFSENEGISEDDLREAIISSNTLQRKSWILQWGSAILLTGLSLSILIYSAYKVHYLDQPVFIPFWVKPYIFEEVMTPEQLQILKSKATGFFLSDIARANLLYNQT